MTIDPAILSAILGPLGALVLAVALLVGLAKVVQVLWRDHLKADADDRHQRDTAFDDLRAQSVATGSVADSYAAIAKEIAELTRAVGVIAVEQAAIKRAMAARRRNDRNL